MPASLHFIQRPTSLMKVYYKPDAVSKLSLGSDFVAHTSGDLSSVVSSWSRSHCPRPSSPAETSDCGLGCASRAVHGSIQENEVLRRLVQDGRVETIGKTWAEPWPVVVLLASSERLSGSWNCPRNRLALVSSSCCHKPWHQCCHLQHVDEVLGHGAQDLPNSAAKPRLLKPKASFAQWWHAISDGACDCPGNPQRTKLSQTWDE